MSRLAEAEREIQRLRGELIALQNVLLGVLHTTLVERPKIIGQMLEQIRVEITRLEDVSVSDPEPLFRKEGAQRFYKRFCDALVEHAKTEVK